MRVLCFAVCLAACSTASAARLATNHYGSGVWALFLDGEAANGGFDTIFLRTTPGAPEVFTNPNSGVSAGVPRPAGAPFTYPNRMLNGDPGDIPGALGLSQFGLVNTSSELSYTVASLGGTITTASQPGNLLFLANVDLPDANSDGQVTVQLLKRGDLVQELFMQFPPFPEPSAFVLAACSLTGLSLIRRQLFGE
jgi:hypothetical protein